MSTRQMQNTVEISEQELQNTLHDFLEENGKKPQESIWNITTLSGLGFVFTAFAYIGHSIATEIFGLEVLPFMYTLMKFMPYLAGAMLGVNILSMFKSSGRKKKEQEMEEKIRVQQTYDKLDELLYTESEKKEKKKGMKSRSFSSLSLNSNQKLFRSRTDKYIYGVCGGLSKYFGISSTAIRIIFLAALFLGYGSFFLVYIAMAIVMPKEPISLMDDFN
jgi:phage shock protein C